MTLVLIPTAGIGSRLGQITNSFNKALIPIGKKPSISHIIDYYPKDSKFIIALGFRGEDIKSFIELAYPDLDVIFVNIENFDGPGSGLSHTLKKCEEYIKSPFFFHANDTIITDKMDFNSISENTIFLNDTYIDPKSYVTASIDEETKSIKNLFPKTKEIINNPLSYIGVAYIKTFEDFKDKLRTLKNGITESDYFIQHCQNEKLSFKKTKSWFDIGDIEKYRIALNELSNFDSLLKEDESIYFIEDKVIKYFKNNSIINNRVDRSKVLKGLVPKIIDIRKNFYSYEYTPGTLLSEIPEIEIEIDKFLQWTINNLWKPIKLNKIERAKFTNICNNFYYEKTLSRVNDFYAKYNIKDKDYIINGFVQKPFSEIIKKIDWKSLSNAVSTGFHGDFHFENILKTDAGYKLLDWRQDFGGIIEFGDVYYDLAKLKHGLIVNHSVVKENLFNININDNIISIDFNRKDRLVRAEIVFNQFLIDNNFSINKVDILTNLIFINIAALHTSPYSQFLYFIGIAGLNELIRKKRI